MINPAPHLLPFDVTCLWLGLDDERIHAVSGEAALRAVLTAHGVDLSTLWGINYDPAEGDLLATWSTTFQGQTWENGDFNCETITVYQAQQEPADCAIPC